MVQIINSITIITNPHLISVIPSSTNAMTIANVRAINAEMYSIVTIKSSITQNIPTAQKKSFSFTFPVFIFFKSIVLLLRV